MSTIRKPAAPSAPGDVAELKLTHPAEPTGPAPTEPPVVAPVAIPPEQRLLNRDLSWLEFNRRVLAQATDPRTPLLTRLRFLAIFSSNLDEFFMKRVGALKHQLELGRDIPTPDGLTPRRLLEAVRLVVVELQAEQARVYEQEIRPALAAHGVHILRYSELTDHERRTLDGWYNANVFPVLTPLAVDPGHRFPFISNLSESIGVLVSQPGEAERHFARIKIPDVLPRLIPVASPASATGSLPVPGPGGLRLIMLDELVRNNLDDLFPGMQVHETIMFRVTRNAAVEIEEEESEDLLKSVENELRLRRFARAVRLEVQPRTSRAVLDFVVGALRLDASDVYERGGPLEYGDLLPITDAPRPELKDQRWTPVIPARLADDTADIFAEIRQRDILLHHPYESFNASVERFIAQAARDPDVLAIKQTIYRTSRDSPFVASLVRAAEDGKSVAVLVELRARFDEHKNVRFARQLEKAGVHVAYGVVGLKTHCKVSLVVRRESGGLRTYAHVGTGNYNPSTAQLYTDLGLLTCDRAITDDAINLFNFLTGRSLQREYRELLVAPFTMRESFTRLIEREIAHKRAGRPARIIAKMNALEDLKITEKLYEASAAGIPVTLIVRGFCCLRPGVPGISENIRVMSVVGRFLEHSRLFHFADGKEDPLHGDWYIGSADWMYRNLSARVEAATPVKDPDARRKLMRLVGIMLADRVNAWDLAPNGTYSLRTPPPDADPVSPAALGTFGALMLDAQQPATK
ncbi:MAG: polyphosphate kinase 1 [Phycisphaerales bacterium]